MSVSRLVDRLKDVSSLRIKQAHPEPAKPAHMKNAL
ncbi:hypothetical protein [Denitrificimonas halotolerans]